MSRFATDYQVARPTGVCAATGAELAPGAVCIATLCDRPEDEGFDRLDFSPEAWDAGERPERLFSYWQTTVPDTSDESKKNILVDDAVLMDVFERLADDARPQRRAFRFVLMLILIRKKLLRFVGREQDEAGGDAAPDEYWLLRPRGSAPEDPPLRVFNPHLQDDDVRELTEQLKEVLQGDL